MIILVVLAKITEQVEKGCYSLSFPKPDMTSESVSFQALPETLCNECLSREYHLWQLIAPENLPRVHGKLMALHGLLHLN